MAFFKEFKLTINPLHDEVAELLAESEVIGYAVKNKGSELLPASIVLPDGKTLGDYHCTGCAIKAAAKNYLGIGEDEAIEANFSFGKSKVRNLLLAALLSSFIDDLTAQSKH
ncbi:hypothetical protein [Yersinia intermedia]|uniref:hypothetical protein n=1 Tax=Yersinia intermedia TaxID=631 RepID=UPI001CFD7273|nr:hypothetical protein [Yersinia intermedia]MCB5312120.1 hypothetical protein [Yersinia intermedia]MCB5326134.1 hypothetical protein [Yersinia intermedia]